MENARPLYPLAFEGLPKTPDFPSMEEEILAYWREGKIFERSLKEREGARDFVFFDGPPFANGL
ncbi:MAG: class I tRNA ligase family protein, partial [Aeriscardovia sp.]|nr:class I tRNA ligase family protein [Aeriscardovia sp.]